MKVLVACEFSGRVRDAFNAIVDENGEQVHHAVSCDLLPSEAPGPHIRDDVLNHLDEDWDLMIAHPPCTDLAVSGARWMGSKGYNRIVRSVNFFRALVECNIHSIAVENPIGIMSTLYRKPDQIIQPWMFGDYETKATCLWLKNLPPLTPTAGFKDRRFVKGRLQRVFREPPGPDRWKNRSRTFPETAAAMAEQWGASP